MSDQPRRTLTSRGSLGGHVAIGAAVGMGIGGAALSQVAPNDESFLVLLRFSMYLGALFALVVWAIRGEQ